MVSVVVLAAVAMASLALAKHLSAAVAVCCDQFGVAKKAARHMARDMAKGGKASKDRKPTIEGDNFW
eukprot:11545545-Ditylum_brightwellii.AAC.1